MRNKICLLAAGLSMVMSLSAGAVERNRGGGIAIQQVDGTVLLTAENRNVDFKNAEIRSIEGTGTASVRASLSDFYPFFESLYAHYSINEREQILTFSNQQIIYGKGVSCVRIFKPASYEALRSGDYRPKPEDEYTCGFVMDLHTGATNAIFFPEPRTRMGAGN